MPYAPPANSEAEDLAWVRDSLIPTGGVTVACIDQGRGKNKKGTNYYWINFDTCIDCGICLQVCPVEGAILPEERPDLQKVR